MSRNTTLPNYSPALSEDPYIQGQQRFLEVEAKLRLFLREGRSGKAEKLVADHFPLLTAYYQTHCTDESVRLYVDEKLQKQCLVNAPRNEKEAPTSQTTLPQAVDLGIASEPPTVDKDQAKPERSY